MADEAPTSETPPQIAEQTPASVEATIESNSQGGTHSSCNNNDKTCAPTSDGDREKSLEYADELMERGSKAAKDRDYPEAAECYSRALEIRVGHYGELAPECVNAYYKYGCVLLYKAQEEADPLGTVPRKEGESKQASDKDGSVKNAINGESSAASVSCNVVKDGSSNPQDGAPNDVSSGKAQEEDDEESDAEDLAEADEDESDLDLAWKMLDVARAIVEKHSNDTMEKVDILSTLAEVALEREDIETSLSDYLKALDILERLVEPDSRHIAELNFRICLCLEIGSKAQEAIPYCQKAISICNSRVQRLMNELNSLSGSTATSAASELDQTGQLSSNGSQSNDSIVDKKAEIETLTGLSGELEKKLEDLEQFVSNPTSILSDILGMVSAKARGIIEKNGAPSVISSSQLGIDSSSGDLDSPTVSTAHSNGAAGVTHLGVVGRGVKRVSMNSAMSESSAMKKPALDPTTDKGDGKAS
ncbi:NASP-related protein sim3-like [Camellia sinensis]|uniref:NASP-related protein sim3-like n=1 Tax=Camellia sinensis TaxID=4442 RepID=UPI0010369983|nr:NASP-related protein sim3-like [Camellia sinensis]